MTMAHHLEAHWVDDDEDTDAKPNHHHLREYWALEDEASPVSTFEISDLSASS
jgi:hypothetical protein